VFDNTQPWDYEIYQSVSLRQINPHAFLELRETGSTSFELKEALFNQDFPGHYCRLLMETKVYFPGAPRYIACTLSLTTHKYRISAERTSYAEHKDEDFRIDKIPITSVAATKSAGGSGLLQPTFHYMNEYFPFEGAGVVSNGTLSLPTSSDNLTIPLSPMSSSTSTIAPLPVGTDRLPSMRPARI
jgi:hypothetical protein